MSSKYLFRLDDACPTMDHQKWQTIEELFDKYDVKPMVGIIPQNADPQQQICSPDDHFWEKARSWQAKSWTIALHGFDHCYTSKCAGINPLWNRSEFAGQPLLIQKQKISDGLAILNNEGIYPNVFFAPSHTFDNNTLIALKECSDIRIISDTIATKPYRNGDFIFLPILGGMPRKAFLPGIWTCCLHPSIMNDESFARVETFIRNNKENIRNFSQLDISNLKPKSLLSKLLSTIYFAQRKIRGIK